MFANIISSLTNTASATALSCLMLLAAGGDAQPEPTTFQKLLPFGLPIGLVFLFYMTMIAPEKRRQREEADLLSSLGKNDRVITIGGMHGTVVAVKDGVITLKVEDGTRIKFNQTAIAKKIDPKKEKQNQDDKD